MSAPKPAIGEFEVTGLITGAQIRGARGMLRWSITDLARACDVSVRTISRLEEEDGLPQHTTVETLRKIRLCLEEHGITILEINGSGKGAGLRYQPPE
jgi:transcriptional regulator with XRE-family HTH domain